MRAKPWCWGRKLPLRNGVRYGLLVVLWCLEQPPRRDSLYWCRCRCGTELATRGSVLLRGRRDCGCVARGARLARRLMASKLAGVVADK